MITTISSKFAVILIAATVNFESAFAEDNYWPEELDPTMSSTVDWNTLIGAPEWYFLNKQSDAAPPFDMETHFAFGTAARACADQLSYAVYIQDIGNAAFSAAHFDNCAFKESLAYIGDRQNRAAMDLTDAQNAFDRYGEITPGIKQLVSTALFRIGQALHGVQDFYSHSNYVEIIEAKYKDINEIPPLRFFSTEVTESIERLIVDKNLVSGTWAIGFPKRCAPGSPTHAQMAKDHFDQGKGAQNSSLSHSYYYVSAHLARRSTEGFLDDVVRKWPVVSKVCGIVLGLSAPHDERKP